MDVSSNLQKEKPQIVCVIGGPGCGKGTQCEKLVRDLKFKHLSIGDLMRAEVQKKTKEGLEIEPYQKEGKLVPTDLTINILLKALKNGTDKRYLIDGFPRTLDQALYFENNYREIDFILNYVVADETMESRILARAAESKEKRADDNPDAVKKRLATYHEQTGKAVNFYKQFGKVREINGEQNPDDVYRDTRLALLPNLIFFYGPPASGQNVVAEHLSNLTGYKYIELFTFFLDHKILDASDEVKMDTLVKYLDSNQERNFIINHFPQNLKQTKIFCDNYAQPKLFYYFDATKDTVETHIYQEGKRQRLHKLEEYEAYTKNRKDILAYFKSKPYFHTIHSNEGTDKMWEQVLENISPEIIVAPQVSGDLFTTTYINKLRTERGYEYINVPALLKDEGLRGTEIARELSLAQEHHDHINEHKLKLIRKVLFKDILRKKFILGGYPETNQQFQYFEKNCCKIAWGLAFTHSGPIQHNNESLLSTLNARGKLIKINNEFIQTFDQYLVVRGNWGFVIGPETEYNTKVSGYLKGRFATTLIDWAALENDIKALNIFLNEDGTPVEELTFAHYCKYFKDLFRKLDKTHNILFDTWPADKPDFNFNKFIQEVGPPTYVIYATGNKDLKLKLLRAEANVPEGEELPEDTVKELEGKYQAVDEQFELFRKFHAQGHVIRLHKIEGWATLPDVVKHLNSFIYRKVLVFRADEHLLKEHNLKNFLTNYCLANGITFVDVPEIIAGHLHRRTHFYDQLQMQISMRVGDWPDHHPSIYTPDIVIALVKDYLYSLPHNKYVLIFGYPSSDSINNDFYPRPLDELYNLENQIGPVRYIATLRREIEDYNINDPPEPKVVKEAPKTKNPDDVDNPEGGDGGDAPPQDAPPADANAGDDDENKKKFDPTQFDWTVSNGVPKTTSQIYHKNYTGKINDQNAAKDYKQHLDASIKEAISAFEKGDEANVYLELLVG